MQILYTCTAESLNKEANALEANAKENLSIWAMLGKTHKYEEAMRDVRNLRDAANTKSIGLRRAMLHADGFEVRRFRSS